jgi:hypothetical protein
VIINLNILLTFFAKEKKIKKKEGKNGVTNLTDGRRQRSWAAEGGRRRWSLAVVGGRRLSWAG